MHETEPFCYVNKRNKAKNGPVNWVGPVLAGDRLILSSSEGQLLNVNALDGKMGSSTKLDAPVYLAPAVAGSTLFLLDNKGNLTAWR